MPRYAVINKENIVVNVIQAFSSHRLPEGLFMVQTEIGDIGNLYIPETKDFDKSNQIGPELPQPKPSIINDAWKQFTGAFRRGKI